MSTPPSTQPFTPASAGPNMPSVAKRLRVKAPVERAFRVFTAGMNRWWPRHHHIGASPLKEIIIEPHMGGRWYSICEDGTTCDIGKVLDWDPPNRLLLAWQVTAQWAFDPKFVTEVEVRFSPDGAQHTQVDFEHRNLDRFGADAESIRAQLDHPNGWHGSLDVYAATLAMKAVVSYEAAADVLIQAPRFFAAHKELLDAFAARGELIAVGTFADPQEGSLSVFRSREAAQDFIAEDPFVLNGVVAKATIKDWREILLP